MSKICPECREEVSHLLGSSGLCYSCAPKPHKCPYCDRGFPSTQGKAGHMGYCSEKPQKEDT